MSLESETDDDAKPMLLEDMIAGITDDDDSTAGAGETGKVAGDEASPKAATEGEGEGDQAGAGDGAEGTEGAGDADDAGRTEPEAEKPGEKKRPTWQEQRLNRLTAEKKAAAKEAADLRAELESLKADRGGGEDGVKLYTQAEVDALVETRSSQRAEATVMSEKLDALYDQAAAKHADFPQRVQAYADAFGPDLAKRVDFFEAMTELPNGMDVLYELGGDLDKMADVLEMKPAKMGMALRDISAQLIEAAKPKPKPVSKAPPPIKPLETHAKTELSMDDDDLPMEEFEKRLGKLIGSRER